MEKQDKKFIDNFFLYKKTAVYNCGLFYFLSLFKIKKIRNHKKRILYPKIWK